MSPAAVPPRSERVDAPLSYAQHSIWLAEQTTPGTVAHNEAAAFRLTGAVDAEALERSLAALAHRHEAMRCAIVVDADDEPRQRFQDRVVHAVQRTDLTSLPDDQREDRLAELVSRTVAAPFDLARPPLMRTHLFRLGEDRHLLLFVAHHIIVDAWGLGIFLEELAAQYAAETGGPSVEEPDPRPDLGDYAARQRTDPAAGRGLDHWRERLGGELPDLRLPVEGHRTERAADGIAGAVHGFVVPSHLVTRLGALARSHLATLPASVLTAFCAVVQRYTGQDDLVVGMPVATRNRSGLGAVIGPLLNVIAHRVDLSGDPSFAQALRRVRRHLKADLANRDTPFALVAEHLAPPVSGGRSPLFQLMYSFHSGPATTLRLPGVETTPVPAHSGTAKYDLSLFLRPRPSGDLDAYLEYRTALLSPQTVEGIAEGLLCLLEAAVAEPGRQLTDLPVMTDTRRHRVLVEFNASDRTPSPWSTVPEALRARAVRDGDVPAVVHGDEVLTRAGTDAAADRVAARLADDFGVRAGDRVALLVPRGTGLVPLIVGLWRAGAVLVPLDETMPDERMAYVLEDSGARLLVTGRSVRADRAGSVPRADAAALLSAHAHGTGALVDEATVPFPDGPPADTLAYLMYTSGSTGRPKGVAVSHGCVANLLHSVVREPGLDTDDVLVAVTSLTFDIAVLELFAPLVAGAKLVIAPHATVRDPEELGTLLRASRATVMQATPSLWRALLDGGWQGLPGLRALSGGEALDPVLAERLLDRCAEVWNLYGPTETTIWSTAGRVLRGEPVTVGRPVARTYCHILDRRGHPVPVGAVGELLIGGAGVTSGYWNRLELTDASFVPDPVGADPLGDGGARVYRTGDLARYLPDGRIVVLGRADEQVKILGHRVELGEIEALLTRHQDVRAAAVVVDREHPAVPRLVAFVVPRGSGSDTESLAGHLRAYLRTVLPAAVVPSVVARLPELPLNTSGKVDRPALTRRARTLVTTAAPEAPATEAERTVVEIWAELLGTDPSSVGVTDDFFAAGGNSVDATRLLGRLRRALGHAPSLADFYASTTPRSLAAALAAASAGGPGIAAAPSPAPVSTGPVPLTDQQRLLWLTQRLAPESAAYNLAATVHLDRPVDHEALTRALLDLVTRHQVLAARCELTADGPVLVPLPADSVRPTVVDAPAGTGGAGAAATREWLDSGTITEASRPFDLAEGPLLRVTVLRGAGTSVLLFTSHHLAMDGWSIGVAVRELAALYAHRTGTGAPLPPPALDFLGHAAAATAPAAQAERTSQLAHWRARLDGHPGVLELPTDPDAGLGQTDAGGVVPVALPPGLTRRLRTTAARLRVTPFTVLLTVYASLLGRYGGTDDVVVGVPAANRGEPELEGVVGSLVNTLPVRVDLTGTASFAELARRTGQRLAADLDRPLVPLDRLVDALGIPRDPARPALVQATLVLQEAMPGLIRLGDATGELRRVFTRTAKYDLTLALEEHPDRIEGSLEYASRRFTDASAIRFVRHLQTLLGAALDDPDAEAALVPLDPEQDATPSPRPGGPAGTERAAHATPVHELFRAQAAARPDAVAVRHDGRSVTYGLLDAWSDRIAARLLGLGAARGRFVSVLLPTGPAQVAAILGVAKTGAAFAVLDPDSPELRLRAVLADARPLCVLTDDRALAGRPGLWERPAGRWGGVPVEVIAPETAHDGASPPVPAAAPSTGDDALCLVYTSGSTGTPKGIALPHTTLAQFADWQGERFGVGPGSRVAQWAPFTYDAAYTEVFAAVCHGATLCVPTDDVRRDPVAVVAWLRAERVTQIQTVPGFFAVMTEALDRDGAELPDLRHVLLAGEVLPPSLAAAWAERSVRPALHNLYGPTECVLATHRELAPAERFAASVPIGVPIPGRQALVLDHRGRPCPVGVVGEIHLRSDFLAGSYHRRTEESAKAYVPDPWRPGGTLYRTGDLGRFLPNGELAFTGRTGSLVKILGNRVELEEIEALLESHPSVREAAAAVHGPPSAPRLVGYAVVRSDVTAAALRTHLAERLPAALVPEQVVLMDALPRTSTNKRDRARLPAPRTALPDSAAPPLAGTEQLVADAWRRVLGADRPVGRHTSFFEAGGNSLLAARLQVELGRRLGREIRLVDIFTRPTIAEFVAGLDDTASEPRPTAPPDDVTGRAQRRRAAARARAGARADRFDAPTRSD
ncbi:non-ribosomal peptide synthetase [Streptomyces caniscabiei]|uniref:Non-ribosomal peptide synthetase n=2 Tax=Streptomyces caniscabiei TaxID=2746961 RepID=A0ABU4N0Y0_9ACTN|nr:non-ribosomal peptide synthetase [Streptomyces caniscabiei]MBE4741685.1 amino acid adenylation domain-containing protein [Streptomyces caniscabiei]MBE4762021.1 amino acid adenylation domain-containing protein [Streptomyces caniscabiei]MBE4775332.1 amino acid adenylation domain-containing protein [Streptomyces caniscabiei]MBE4790485.1 amino acid adenylation domain-containing protein [Streptomyces caniscabiei]MBE4799652.1 amino acid adenylation domain-containing protein [Streptomyces caniscab